MYYLIRDTLEDIETTTEKTTAKKNGTKSLLFDTKKAIDAAYSTSKGGAQVMSVELLQILSVVAYILAVVMLVLSIILFFVLNIRKVIGKSFRFYGKKRQSMT